jgi:hypothetical protein
LSHRLRPRIEADGGGAVGHGRVEGGQAVLEVDTLLRLKMAVADGRALKINRRV